MAVKPQYERIVFGLKLRQSRKQTGLSLVELSKQTGISVSYLNEIEKAKKFPKEEKIKIIAKHLNTTVKKLTSTELTGKLSPVSDLLKSNFLNELPLDIFGIDLAKIVQLIADAPSQVGAFISTLVELSRNYAFVEENFFFGALRSYLEIHNNYFPDIERDVEIFAKKYHLWNDNALTIENFEKILTKKFGYKIIKDGFKDFPEFHQLRAVFLPEKKQLLLNNELSEMQVIFQYGKELGFNYLNLKERALTSSLLKVKKFEEVLNHFKAGYFSVALLIRKDLFIEDLKAFFAKSNFESHIFIDLLNKYNVLPETLFQRMTNILPGYFGIDDLFLIKMVHTPDNDDFLINRELHLKRRHHPHSNKINEHYCRRWRAISLLKKIENDKSQDIAIGVQRSHYFNTDDEYFLMTISRRTYPPSGKNVSITIGMLIDDTLREKIKFIDNPSIHTKIVNKTCERCPIENCKERAAKPTVVLTKKKMYKIFKKLDEISDANSNS